MKKLILAAVISCVSFGAFADMKASRGPCVFKFFYNKDNYSILNADRISQIYREKNNKIVFYTADEKFTIGVDNKKEVQFVMNQLFNVMKTCEGDVVLPGVLDGNIPDSMSPPSLKLY